MVPASSSLESCPDFPQGWTVTWKCKLPSLSCVWSRCFLQQQKGNQGIIPAEAEFWENELPLDFCPLLISNTYKLWWELFTSPFPLSLSLCFSSFKELLLKQWPYNPNYVFCIVISSLSLSRTDILRCPVVKNHKIKGMVYIFILYFSKVVVYCFNP